LDHEGKKSKLYCTTCEKFICIKCTVKRQGGKHHDHDYDEVDSVISEIKSSRESMEKQKATVMEAQEKLKIRHQEISAQQKAAADNVHVAFKQLRDVLDDREGELIKQLDRITEGKLKRLAPQEHQISTILAQLNNCLSSMSESLSKEDVLRERSSVVQQVKELTTPFQPDILKPNTEADIEISVTESMIENCQNYVQLLLSCPPDPSKCHVTGMGEQAAVGETSTAILNVCNSEGTPCKGPIKAVECEVVSEITGTRVSCSVERRGESQYEISYQPTIKGKHRLHVKVQGQHVRRSPLPITVKLSIEKLGTPFHTISGLKQPWGVAINQKGEVVVAECDGHQVSVFSPKGERLHSFSKCGSGLGEIHNPREIALDGEGNILVADHRNNRIQKFDHEGKLLELNGTKGSGQQQFKGPTGVAYNACNGKWYVTDSFNHRIKVLNSDLTLSSTFGNEGDGEGQFQFPNSIACDSTGKVYVVDSANHRIQVFTEEGIFKMKFNSYGPEGEKMDNPIGIAIDTSDMVYVCEDYKHRVSVFTSEGQFVTSFEGFQHPRGLAVDNSGVVYVCDRDNNRVQIL
jgi:tripartite motif-containing protein 2/3/tripartite motif-containing protein 71